jgi:hypothetical protein
MVRDELPTNRDVPEEVGTLKLDQIEVKSYVGGLDVFNLPAMKPFDQQESNHLDLHPKFFRSQGS